MYKAISLQVEEELFQRLNSTVGAAQVKTGRNMSVAKFVRNAIIAFVDGLVKEEEGIGFVLVKLSPETLKKIESMDYYSIDEVKTICQQAVADKWGNM